MVWIVFALVALGALHLGLEGAFPATPRTGRWRHLAVNLALAVVCLAAWAPLAAVTVAVQVRCEGSGLLQSLPDGATRAVTAFLALDAAAWMRHRAMHGVPALWRVHRVHHADADLDVSTAIRFHPAEVPISWLWQVSVVAILGVPAGALLAWLGVSVAVSLLAHANVRFPEPVDRALRRLVVTPSVHRLHHSRRRRHAHRNFGEVLCVWDRLAGTWREGEADAYGVDGLDEAGRAGLAAQLTLPLSDVRATGPG